MENNYMGRIRESRNRDLERYVKRDARGYVRYKHPNMDKPQFFGKDVAAANEVARAINAYHATRSDVIQKILAPESGTPLSQIVARFTKERVPQFKWSAGYERENLNKLKTLCNVAGDRAFSCLDVLGLNNLIDENFSGDSRRVARNLLIHVYRYAIGRGLHKGPNVAEQVLEIPKAERVRQRIANYAAFLKIREHAIPVVRDAMDVAIISLQARQELCNMRLKDYEGGKLKIVRQKTDQHILIEVGEDLHKTLHQCKVKAMRYGSPFMLNHASRVPSKNKSHRTQVLPDYLSRAFTEAVDACKLYEDVPLAQRPTLHEVRSLGGRLYKAMGKPDSFIQALYGHAKIDMTEHYLEGDKVVWLQASADMDLSVASTVSVNE